MDHNIFKIIETHRKEFGAQSGREVLGEEYSLDNLFLREPKQWKLDADSHGNKHHNSGITESFTWAKPNTSFRFTGLFTLKKEYQNTLKLCYFIPRKLLRVATENSFPLGKVTLGGQDPWGSKLSVSSQARQELNPSQVSVLSPHQEENHEK